MPRLVKLQEFDRTPIPIDELVRDGRLDIYPGTAGQDLFELQVRREATYVQARGWIGTIPLNDALTLHVVPRVPIGNLTRLLQLSRAVPKLLVQAMRGYERTGEFYPSLLNLYTEAMCTALDQIVQQGYFKEYQRREAVTSVPRGRILVGATMHAAGPRNKDHVAAVSWYQRSIDNAVNRCLLFAVHKLAAYNQQAEEVLAPAERREIARRINLCAHQLQGVTLDQSAGFLSDPIVLGTAALPQVRGHYRPALDVALTIILGRGVSIDVPGETVRLPSLLIDMSSVFENYVRNVLIAAARRDGWTGRVLDGNFAPGQKRLLEGGVGITANPDVVVAQRDSSNARYPVVLEVKYKPAKDRPDRKDLNQALAYGMSYRSDHIVLVQPRDPVGRVAGLSLLGTLMGSQVWMYVFDTASSELEAEEHRFSNTVRSLIGHVETR